MSGNDACGFGRRPVEQFSKRLAIFLPSLEVGGAERSMLTLAEGLAAGHDVDLVLARRVGAFLSEVSPKIRVIDLSAPQYQKPGFSITRQIRSLFHPGGVKRDAVMFCLARYLRQHRPSALLSSLEYSNLNAILAREISGMNLSVILTIQNTLGRHSESDQFERLVVFATKGLFRLADCVVAVSHGVAEDLAKIAPGARRLIRVIYNPVVGPNLYSRSLEKPGHSWLLDGGPPVFLGVGRLVPQKDFSTLLRAFKRVRNQIPARLLILGEGPLRGELESLASELGIREDVSMPGIDANPFPYFRRAPVFVLSSAWEGLANVLIEALALGARVVSTDCPSGPREILEGGRWGSLVRVGDDAAMAQAMLLSLKQPRRDSAEAGLAVGRFRVETVVQEFKKILPSLQPRGEREC